MTDDRLAYVTRLIIARCPELGLDDLAALAGDQVATLPLEIGEQVLDVLEALEAKLDALVTRMDKIAA
jgi:hypothetical protein